MIIYIFISICIQKNKLNSFKQANLFKKNRRYLYKNIKLYDFMLKQINKNIIYFLKNI